MAPLYEYACDKCETRFDSIEKQRDKPTSYCPECGSSSITPQLTYAANYTIGGNNSASTRPKKSRSTQ